jgi:hypothetical protein
MKPVALRDIKISKVQRAMGVKEQQSYIHNDNLVTLSL